MRRFVCIYYHIVFSTKSRKPVLVRDRREDLFRYIWGILKNKDCILYRINAVDDHIHILISLHPTICLSDLIRDLKRSTTKWIKDEGVFPGFGGWQDGYGAFTVSESQAQTITEYIKSQEEHHKKKDYVEELRQIIEEHHIEYEDKHLI